jgi:hypothetical protein
MQPGASAAGDWPFPLFWSQVETIFHIGNWGIDHIVNPLLTLPPAKLDWVNGLLTWLGIRDASSDEEVCDLIEEWADEVEYPETLWGAETDTGSDTGAGSGIPG